MQRIDEGEQKVGGIIIPDTAKEKPQQGKVIAVGAGKTKDDGKRIALDVKEGDTILFGKYRARRSSSTARSSSSCVRTKSSPFSTSSQFDSVFRS